MVRTKRILIVEDDEAIRETLRIMLALEGYDVNTASNGKEALELLLHGERPSLILLDLMMPVMNGFEFAAALQKDARISSIPFVLLTAFAEQAGKVVNAKGVLSKPLEFELLFRTLRDFCG